MPSVLLRLLGTPTIEIDGVAKVVPLRTPSSLLFYLATEADWVPRSELGYLYRPDETESSALTYLRLQLHRAQRFAWARNLEVEADRVRWLVDSDIRAIRSAADDQRWTDVIDSYAGDFLAGAELRDRPTYNAWLELERDGLRRTFATALRRQALAHESEGDHLAASALYARLARLDEFDETAVLDLLRTLAGAGEVDRALAYYDTHERRIEAEFGVEPSSELAELVAGIRRGAATTARAPRKKREMPPRPTTRFIGRGSELAELTAMLGDPGCRLLTIVGLGGSGKTRLLLELERTIAQGNTIETVFVPLLTAATTEEAVYRIANGVGLEAEAGSNVEERLLEHLSGRQILLFLDNLEQLVGLRDFLSRLMASTSTVKVASSSRTRLNLHGEWLYDLRGLNIANAGEDTARQAGAAVELFISAARRVAPRAQFSDAELKQVADICRQVDGLPLAIELAAGWMRALPLDRIVSELAKGHELLRSDTLDLPERHRNLEAILDKTWAGLDGAKSQALRRLSVFRGSFGLEAGEHVSGASLPVLLSLINQSLLTRDAGGRLSSHPLVAKDAGNRLAEDPRELAATLDSHADFYSQALRAIDPRHRAERRRTAGSTGAKSAGAQPTSESLMELDPDLPNLEQAWFRLLETSSHGEAYDVVEGLISYYVTRGHYQQGGDVVERSLTMLAATEEQVVARLACSLMLAQATLAREVGDFKIGLEHADRALTSARSHGLASHAAVAQRYRGDMLQMLGEFDEAGEAYRLAIEILEGLDEPTELANTLNSLASMDAVQERFESATALFERCVQLFEQVGNELDKAVALNNLGYIADAQGDWLTSARRYEQSLEAFKRIQFSRGISAVKNNLVVLYGVLGRYDDAERLGQEALKLKEQMNDRLGKVITLKNLGDLQLMQSRPLVALDYLRPAIKLAVDLDATPRLLQVLVSYAGAMLRVGDADVAEQIAVAVLGHPITPPSLKQKLAQLAPEFAVDVPTDETLVARLLPELSLIAS